MTAMKLYWAPRTRSLIALWALEESGLAYERVLIDIRAGAQNDPAFKAINPMAKVPALEDGAARLAENAAICAYVAERAAPGLLAPPPGAPERGRYLHWLFFGAGCIEAAFTQKFMKFEMPTSSAGWGDADRVFSVIAAAVAAGPWLLGERFTAADVMVGAEMHFARQFRILADHPEIDAYIERCLARPAFQRALAIDAESVI